MSMENYFWQRIPRQLTQIEVVDIHQLTQIEVVDIHLIVRATHPHLGTPAQFKEKKSDDKQN